MNLKVGKVNVLYTFVCDKSHVASVYVTMTDETFTIFTLLIKWFYSLSQGVRDKSFL